MSGAEQTVKSEQVKKRPRNANVELLRITAMLMIVVLHYLGGGGGLYLSKPFGHVFVTSWLIEAFMIVAVNCYVLISGYHLVTASFKVKNILSIWVQVFTYSIVISAVLWITGTVPFTLHDLLFSLLPVLTNEYWFVTAYLALYLLFPFLNIAIKAMSKRQMQILLMILFAAFSVWNSFFPFVMSLDTTGGYGIIWFVFLYFTAAYLRLHYERKAKPKTYLIVYFVSALLIASSKFLLSWLSMRFDFASGYSETFYLYDSALAFIAAVSLFLFFINIEIKNARFTKIILGLSGLTFGVYLIHQQLLLRGILWVSLLHADRWLDSPWFLANLAATVTAVYSVCSLIEFLRQRLFAKFPYDRAGKALEKRLASSKLVSAVTKLIN